MSKYAVVGMTRIMALEYAQQKIRVNAVAPTAIETELIRAYIENADDKETARKLMTDVNPMLGPGDTLPQVEDVSGVVAFLCGPEAKFINGAIIPVDGGFSCN